MPTNIRLTTMPGKIRKGRIGDALVLDLLGSSLGQEDIPIRKPADVVAAVRAFGERIRAAHPDASFMVNVSIRKGERKPPGYDAAEKAGLFDNRAFMHVETETRDAIKAASAPGPVS
jgi:hypothetical protein